MPISTPPPVLYGLRLFLAFTFILAFHSCEKEELSVAPAAESVTYDADGFYRFPEIPYGPGPTRLGKELPNPYELSNMQHAADLLGISAEASTQKSATGQLTATHVYVKMTPRTGEEYVRMMEAAEKYDLTFQEQPLHYEALYQGEEGYRDPSVADDELPPMYGAIPVERYNKTFKKMRHTARRAPTSPPTFRMRPWD